MSERERERERERDRETERQRDRETKNKDTAFWYNKVNLDTSNYQPSIIDTLHIMYTSHSQVQPSRSGILYIVSLCLNETLIT